MELTVESTGGDSHRITVRGHSIQVDQTLSDGGGDSGPTPVELFVASLAACVAHYARRALGAQSPGATVRCAWTMSDTPPWRVAAIDIRVDVPEETTPARLAAVQRAVGHCTVHNTLVDLPVIRIDVPPVHALDRAVA